MKVHYLLTLFTIAPSIDLDGRCHSYIKYVMFWNG